LLQPVSRSPSAFVTFFGRLLPPTITASQPRLSLPPSPSSSISPQDGSLQLPPLLSSDPGPLQVIVNFRAERPHCFSNGKLVPPTALPFSGPPCQIKQVIDDAEAILSSSVPLTFFPMKANIFSFSGVPYSFLVFITRLRRVPATFSGPFLPPILMLIFFFPERFPPLALLIPCSAHVEYISFVDLSPP